MSNICEYFGWCGGCTLQDKSYAEQLALKRQGLANVFNMPDLVLQGTEQWHYRNRMDFTIFFKGLGMRRRGRHDFVEVVRQCPIAHPKINEALAEVWAWFEANKPNLEHFHIRTLSGTLRQCTLRVAESTGAVTAIFMLNSDAPRLEEQRGLLREFAKTCHIQNVLMGDIPARHGAGLPPTVEIVKGDILIHDQVGPVPLTYHALGFAQGNPKGFMTILEYVRTQIMQSVRQPKLIDLYGGAGTFGFYLSDLFTRVEIIDNEGVNIDCAKVTAQLPQYSQVQVTCADADVVAEVAAHESVLLVDPPRSGIHPKTLKKIIATEVPLIIYVSCNPKQLSAELPIFLESYTMESIMAYDLFPNTAHTEAVVVLKKKQ